jgi:mannose-6-phosphate isomerase
MWFITDATPEAQLFVGLKSGVERSEFENRLLQGTVAECFHRIAVSKGDAMWLPSGRVHGLGAGIVMFEIQQNSDTTYRVFDWNRVGLDGQPRQLHIAQAMASISFNDFEPDLIHSKFSRSASVKLRFLLEDSLFSVHALQIRRGQRFYLSAPAVSIVGLVEGRLGVRHAEQEFILHPGQFCMIPACLERVSLTAQTRVTFLQVQAGAASVS